MTDSKLSIHINTWNNEAEEFAECQPVVLKSIEHNSDKLKAFKATSPGTLTIGRAYIEDGEAGSDDPKKYAQQVADLVLNRIKGCRYDVLEGINEPGINTDDEAKKLCEFNIHLARLIKAEGFQYAAYSFSATRPDIKYAPYLGEALRESDYLAMHAYGPGPLFHDSYWFLFAYRLFWNALDDFYKEGLKGILLTEFGTAQGLKWTQKDVGWKYDAQGQSTPEEYGADLIEADKQLDIYVKGTTIFQTGDIGRFHTFEIKELLPRLKQHIRSFVRPGGNAPNPPNPDTGMEQPIRVLMANGDVVKMELEEYLKGVLPREMGHAAPTEALRAQAVAARCYAMAAIKSPRHRPDADICVTTHCQVYGENRWPETDQAVDATKGVVATYDGKVISAFYSGHCDGRTRKPTTAHPTPWLVDVPYLVPVDCICGYDEMYGHGVGMCQRGAMAMAEQGAFYEEILWHYYRGTAVDGETAPESQNETIQGALESIGKAKNTLKTGHELAMRHLDEAEEGLMEA